jgi:autotransporter-associated beta strand protein
MKFLFAAALSVASFQLLEAATYYVSPSGHDTNPGTLEQPFRTVQKGASAAVASDTVVLRAGTYRETVTPAASGTSGAPITFQNHPGEIATVSGNDVLTGWTSLGGGVFRAPMAWNYNYELVTNTAFPSNQVFLDGQMLNLLRWPKETNHDLVANPREGVIDSAIASGSNVILTDAEFTENPSRWVGAKVWVNLARNGNDGQGQTGTVTAASTGQLTLLGIDNRMGNQPWGVGTGTRYHLFHPTASALAGAGGVAAALAPGEWWFDSAAGQMYVRTWDGQPPAETTGERGTVEARRRSWAFALDSRSWINVRGLHLFAASIRTDNSSATRGSSVAPANNILLDGLNGQYLTHFTDCTGNFQMQWISKSGLILSGSNITLQNSILRYSAGSGVSVLGQRNRVLNNVISDMNYSVSEAGALNLGKTYDTAAQTSLDHEIANNTIYRTPQQGINFRGLKNSANSPSNTLARIHHNVVHDAMIRSHDSAAIDSFGTNHQFVRVDHNHIFNFFGQRSYGVYFDFASGGVIDHNLIFETRRPININWTNTSLNQNMRVFNNTALADVSTSSGLSTLGNTSTASEIRNNLFSGSIPTISGAVSSNNLVSSNPLYTNVPLHDFTLAAGATTAINQGVVTPFDDPISGAAPDIGSFERGQPAWSAGSSLLPLQPAPTGLIATQLDSSTVQLGWTDRSNDETHFMIMRSSDGGTSWNEIGRVPADAQTFTDTRIPAGRYLYAVRGDRSPFSARAGSRGNSAQQLFYPGLYDGQSGGISVFGETQIGGTDPGEWIRFDNIDFGVAGSVTTFTANYSSGQVNGEVQVWLDHPSTGTRIATLIAGTNDWVYRDVSGPVSATASGVHNVFLKFTHSGTANMATFRFIGNAPSLPPAEPSALTASWNGTAVQLAWADNASNENEFRIERSVSGGPFTFLARSGANATSATDATTLPGVHYRYRICAANMAAPSEFGLSAMVKIPGASPPSGLVATAAGSNFIDLTWTDNSLDELSFKIERSTTPGSGFTEIASVGPGVTTYRDSTLLTASTAYYYRVRIETATQGFSAYSPEASATTLSNQTPAAPGGLAASWFSDRQVNLLWTINSSTHTGFVIERRTGTGAYAVIATASMSVNTFNDITAVAGTSYTYRVRARNGNGDSLPSNEAIPAGATWKVNASGNWSTFSNWTTTFVPNVVGAQAVLGPVITSSASVTLDTNVTLGFLTFNEDAVATNSYAIPFNNTARTLTFDVTSGSAAINARGVGGYQIGTQGSGQIILNDSVAISAGASGTGASEANTISLNSQITGTGGLVLSSLNSTDGTGFVTTGSRGTALRSTVANTFSGGVTVNSGYVRLVGNIGNLGSGPLTLNASEGTNGPGGSSLILRTGGGILAKNIVFGNASNTAGVNPRLAIQAEDSALSNYTLTGSLSGSISTQTVRIGSTGTSNNHQLTFSGDGSGLNLGTSSTFQIRLGTVVINHAHAFGSGNGNTANNGGRFQLGNLSSATAGTSGLLTNGFNVNGNIISQAATASGNTNTDHIVIGGTHTSGTATFAGSISLARIVGGTRQLQLTSATGGTTVFGGIISDAAVTGSASAFVPVHKIGAGTVILSAPNTYSGRTTVTAGTLQLGANNVIADASNVSLAGGTLAPGGFSETAGALAVSGASTLDFTGGGALAFAASEAQTWNANLTVRNSDAATCTLRFGTSSNALTQQQLGAITINGGAAAITADGYVTTPAAAWRWTNFRTFSPAGDAADSADPDDDGISNLLERGLGLDPNLASNTGLPSVGTNADRLTLTFTRAAGTTDLTFRVEATDDLTETPTSWTAIYTQPGVNIADEVTVQDIQTVTGNPRRFLRLKITSP